MDGREEIRELISSLNSLSYDDDRQLDAYLAHAKTVIHELFGDYNAYLTCLSYIRFHPISPHSSVEDNVRFWARAKKELRDFLYVMLDDPYLVARALASIEPQNRLTARDHRPAYEINSSLREVIQALRHKVRVDLSNIQVGGAPSIRFEEFKSDGPRTMVKIRIDLRDLYVRERNSRGISPKRFQLPQGGTGAGGVLFFPGINELLNSEVIDNLTHMGVPVIEGEPLTHTNASVQEQLLRHQGISVAVIVLNDNFLAQSVLHADEDQTFGPSLLESFTLGFLVARLGRGRVFALYAESEHYKRPTNYVDVVYVSHDHSGSWKKELSAYFRELRFALRDSPIRQFASS